MPFFSGRPPRFAVALGASLIGLLASPALADPAPPFHLLLAEALQSAPRLAEAQAEVDQSRSLAAQSSVRPNPTVSFEIENAFGTGPLRGLSATELTASIEQNLELGGRRTARIQSGRAAVSFARARADRTRSEFAADLAEAYVQAEASHLRLRFAREALELAQQDLRVADALVGAGHEAELRSVQATAAASAAQAQVAEAMAARTVAFARLTAMSGSATPITSITVGLLAHADRDEAFRRPDPLTTPSYRAAQGDIVAAAGRVRIEQTRSRPDITVSVGVRRVEETGATAFVAGISSPLPLFDRNRGATDAAMAERRGAEARLDAARLNAEAEAISTVARAEAASVRLAASQNGERAAAEASRLALIAYQSGRLSLLELLATRRAHTEARTQSLNARLERLSAEAALARLSGVTPFGDQP